MSKKKRSKVKAKARRHSMESARQNGKTYSLQKPRVIVDDIELDGVKDVKVVAESKSPPKNWTPYHFEGPFLYCGYRRVAHIDDIRRMQRKQKQI